MAWTRLVCGAELSHVIITGSSIPFDLYRFILERRICDSNQNQTVIVIIYMYASRAISLVRFCVYAAHVDYKMYAHEAKTDRIYINLIQ